MNEHETGEMHLDKVYCKSSKRLIIVGVTDHYSSAKLCAYARCDNSFKISLTADTAVLPITWLAAMLLSQ